MSETSLVFSWAEYIDLYCRTKTGGLNNRVWKESWWDPEILASLKTHTSWLLEPTDIMERLYCAYHNLASRPICYCGKNSPKFRQFKSGYWEFCSLECSGQSPTRVTKIQKTTNDRFGVGRKAIVARAAKNNMMKYGVEYTTQTDNFKQKAKITKLERYGDENYCNYEAIKQTNLAKYGVEYTTQATEVKKKMRTSILERNDGKLPCQKHLNHDIIAQLNDFDTINQRNKNGEGIEQIADSLGVTPRAIRIKFEINNIEPIFYFPGNKSKEQDRLQLFIESFGFDCIKNTKKIIAPKEIDIYIPTLNLAIEYNGNYFHSFSSEETPEQKNKHNQKRLNCEAKGLRLIQIWEDDWLNKQDIVKSIIRRAIGKTPNSIGARQTTIIFPTKKETEVFVNTHHIQGHIRYKHSIGLSDKNGNIIQLMTFGKPRWSKLAKWEILRLVTHSDYRVIGGAEKLLKAAKDHWLDSDSIITYSDNLLFTGETYKKLGFVLHHESSPSYFYWKKGISYSRFQFQKHLLKKKLSNFSPQLSESANMFNNGYRRYWDCGTKVWLSK